MPVSTQAASICPACGGANNCALAAGNTAEECWCMQRRLDRAVIERYRDSRRCLCAGCGTILDNNDRNDDEDNETCIT